MPRDSETGIFPSALILRSISPCGANSEARGGSITSPNTINIRPELPNIIDNDGETALDLRASAGGQSARVLGIIIDLDLGARFGINRFKFFPPQRRPGVPRCGISIPERFYARLRDIY